MVRKTLIVALLTVAWIAPAAACGPDSDCTILGERTYRIAMPDGEGPFGAILFMHGYRGSAAGVMRNDTLRAMARALGVALVAPKSGGPDWLLAYAPRKGFTDNARELPYFDALIDDITTRFPIDPDRLLATGFSAGGMMTWTLACHRSDRFAAFAPIAGTFWAPVPDACPNEPVDLVHVHGTSDPVVPIEGRAIADTAQGDVRDALALFRETGGYDDLDEAPAGPDGLTCSASRNGAGAELLYCLHPGGHIYRARWVAFAYERYVARD